MTEAREPDGLRERVCEGLAETSLSMPPDKAVVYIYRPLLTTKADLDWAEFYARQRAQALALRVTHVLVVDNSNQDRMGMLYALLREIDCAVVITPSLAHVGGNARRVTAFAELQTVEPAECHQWRLRVSRRELDEALTLERESHSGARESRQGVAHPSTAPAQAT